VMPVFQPLTRDVDVHPATSGTLGHLGNLASLESNEERHPCVSVPVFKNPLTYKAFVHVFSSVL